MFQKRKSGIRNQFPVPYWVHTSFYYFLFHQHVRHKMILKIKHYLSAYNEYNEVSVEGAYINMKLGIGYREPGTGSLFLI